MSWNHNSGFNVHTGKPINGADGEAIERLARYMSRAPLSVERIHYHAEEQTVTVDAGKSKAGSRKWPVPEFFVLLAAQFTDYRSMSTRVKTQDGLRGGKRGFISYRSSAEAVSQHRMDRAIFFRIDCLNMDPIDRVFSF